MSQNYCGHCGKELKINANFCSSCGNTIVTNGSHIAGGNHCYRYEVNVPLPEVREHLPFSCILAYIPMLFWLPLVTDSEDDTHRVCANQGLWLTILSFVFGVGLIVGCGYLQRTGIIDFAEITKLYTGWTATNWPERLRPALICQAILPFVLYVPINSICGFFHGMGSRKPFRIPTFGRIRLIK